MRCRVAWSAGSAWDGLGRCRWRAPAVFLLAWSVVAGCFAEHAAHEGFASGAERAALEARVAEVKDGETQPDWEAFERGARGQLEQARASRAVVEEVVSFGLDGDEIAGVLRDSSRRVSSIRQLRATLLQRERDLGLARLSRVRLLGERREAPTQQRREAIQAAIDTHGAQVDRLGSLIEVERKLLAEASALSAAIDKQLLWTKSVPAVGFPSCGRDSCRWWLPSAGGASPCGLRSAPTGRPYSAAFCW